MSKDRGSARVSRPPCTEVCAVLKPGFFGKLKKDEGA